MYKYTGLNESKVTIEMPTLPPGVYLFQVQNDDKIRMRKYVIKE
jgi:hypothetical protein